MTPRGLKALTLEDLAELEVTSVSKRAEPLWQAASAIQVITAEEIRRSGATTLPDALRLAANVEVQQINSYAWVVGTRGFDTLFSNKLLVMIDGRSVYSPLDAGVFWDAQNVVLEDVDRIEVISGPGGTLWGANAVNGVINIVTRSAAETQGLYARGGGGSQLQNLGVARIGARAGKTAFRVYGQRWDRRGTDLPAGGEGHNAWRLLQGGFRADRETGASGSLTIQGDAWVGTEFNVPNDRSTLDEQNVLVHWQKESSPGTRSELRASADRTWREDKPSTIAEQLQTYDVDLQQSFRPWAGHDALVGADYRVMLDDAQTRTPIVGFVPPRRDMRLFGAFLQDEIALVPDRLRWTVGAKIENTEFSGFEFEPGTRLAWFPSERQMLWGAVSRAVRAPSRIDVDYHIPKAPPFLIAGGPDFDSEELVAYELGSRTRIARPLTLGLAAYYNHYDRLYSVESQTSASLFPFTIQNGAAGQSWGFEATVVYEPAAWWRLRGGYSWLDKDLWSRPGHDVLNSVLASLGNDPKNQATVHSMIDLGSHVQWDVVGRYVDALPQPAVPSYATVDTRLAYRTGSWELEISGANLTDDRHPEFDRTQEVPRSFFASLRVYGW